MKNQIKIFIIASSLPATILALGGLAIGIHKNGSVVNFAFLWISVSIIFGMFNVLTKIIRLPRNFLFMFLAGAVLGLGLSSVGTFVLNLPELVYGMHGIERYKAILIAPFFYGFIWAAIVYPMEKLFGVEKYLTQEGKNR